MSAFERNNFTVPTLERRYARGTRTRKEIVTPILEGGMPLQEASFDPGKAEEPFHFFDSAQGVPGSQHEKNTLLYKIRKPVQVVTLGTAELLLSGTAVTAGAVVAGGYIQYPLSGLLTNTLTLSSPSLTLSIAGLTAIVIGLKYGRSTLRKIRSAF